MDEQEVLSIASRALEEDTNKILQRVFVRDEVYILLSDVAADLVRGLSVPYIGTLKDGHRMILVFTSLKNARDYVDVYGLDKPEGNYMIGKLEKKDQLGNLYAICNTALQLGIYGIDVDSASPDAFGCSIEYFFKVNEVEPTNVSVISSEEDMAKALQDNGGKLPIHFNMIPIINYRNPYEVNQERAKILLGHVFNAGRTVKEAMETFSLQENLNENVFVADTMNRKLVAQAKQNGKDGDLNYFYHLNALLEKVVWERLAKEQKLFTLYKKDSKELFTVNDCMYVLYTDYFKNMGSFDYKPVAGRAEVEELIEKNNIKGLLVTDGPSKMIVIEQPVFEKK